MTTFDHIFTELFPWWGGSESLFLSAMGMLTKIDKEDADWVSAFHTLKVISTVLKNKRCGAALIHNIIESAYKNNNTKWFEPYANTFLLGKLNCDLTAEENNFLLEMSKIESESDKKRGFAELMFNWREVKLIVVRNEKKGCFTWLFKSQNNWNRVQRESAFFRQNFNFNQ
jgi:hypothetical protein